MANPFAALFGTRRDRLLKKMGPVIARINALESGLKAQSDDQLKAQTPLLRQRLENGETLDQILPEAFALVREASMRVLGQRPYDVQLMGAMALHQGKIAEMRTGEGKTLVATMPAYLNALANKGVHIVTVNDYLAARDARTMGAVFSFLGLTTGVIASGQETHAKRAAYACDITYGTNNEFGFDYLRDNMATEMESRVQRGLSFAIIDEVDSILIDEARTPLIISGPDENTTDVYTALRPLPARLVRQTEENGPGDYWVDEKDRRIHLSEEGLEHAEELLNEVGLLGDDVYSSRYLSMIHHLDAALKAHTLYHLDNQYVLRDNQVIIVDEFTGRTLAGRRWSDGLHQALEAKEGVDIRPEDQVMATITLQNYFRNYAKLSGMTGTADTEAFELQQTYGLEVLVIPTHRPMIRVDHHDSVMLSRAAKFTRVAEEIQRRNALGQPVLVGTTSIEVSEQLSDSLNALGIEHSVLNAKQHEREAEVVAQAGRPGQVTIATNMAGRGTDIVLGGSLDALLNAAPEGATQEDLAGIRASWQQAHDAAIAAGGLHIIGTERHESRRIDNQLRGRSGRQGDPGSSQFFLSMEDHLLKVFVPEWAKNMLRATGMGENDAIESGVVNKQVEAAQRKIEAFYFDQRKSLLEYDNVTNKQRTVVYGHRDQLLAHVSAREEIDGIISDLADDLAQAHTQATADAPGDISKLASHLADHGLVADEKALAKAAEENDATELSAQIQSQFQQQLEMKSAVLGVEHMGEAEQGAVLAALDIAWREQLMALDMLKKGIHLRAIAQKQPKEEYKREAFELFKQMLSYSRENALRLLLRYQKDPSQATPITTLPAPASVQGFQSADAIVFNSGTPPPRRNDPCPCGSGLRYKQCHGALVAKEPAMAS
jgi:preprotein translocase subunit SecA